jgi:hypothetical protein
MSIDFETLQALASGKAVADVACPLCSANCRTNAGRNKKVLRIWQKAEDFITFTCVRCGESGYAHDGNRPVRNRDDVADIVAAFQPKTVVPFRQPQPDKDKLAVLRSLWRRSVPARGTIVQTYLQKRGCWVDSETIRFLPARDGYDPALIVPFGIPDEPEPGVLDITTANIYGVQLTKLKPDGSGKADVEPKKITLGQCVGYPIVLAPPNDPMALTVAEGVEDALSNHLVSRRGAWAAGGANRMPALADAVPSFIESATILVDDNEAGRRGSRELARRLHARGVEVLLLPSGGGVDVA